MSPEKLDELAHKFADQTARGHANHVDELEAVMLPFRLRKDDADKVESMTVMPLNVFMSASKVLCRLMAHKTLEFYNADGYLFCTEAWMASQPWEPGTKVDWESLPAPSEHPNRVSILKVSGRLRTGYGVSLICKQSNLTGERFTAPFEKYDPADGVEQGLFSNFFESEEQARARAREEV